MSLTQLVDALDHLQLGRRHCDLHNAGGDQAAVVAVHQPDKLTPGRTQTGNYMGNY